MEAGRIDPHALRGAPAPPAPATGAYSLDVNGLRGLCVACVFLFHAWGSGLAPTLASDAAAPQWLSYLVGCLAHGVEVFFMISGYVIVLSLRRHDRVRDFLRDRLLRIFPLWLSVLGGICLIGPWLGWQPLQALGALGWLEVLPANALLLAPLLPVTAVHPGAWSLTYEWLFYLAAAAIVAMLRRPQWPHWAWAPIAGTAAGLGIVHLPGALFFLSGVFVALWSDRLPWRSAVRALGAPVPALLLLSFLLLWRAASADDADPGASLWVLIAEGQGLAVLAAFVVGTAFFACVARPGPAAMPVLRSVLLQRLGTISYSFYLCHLLVMFAAKRVVTRLLSHADGWLPLAVFTVLSGLLSWALAWLGWRWIEQGLGGWLRRAVREFRRSVPAPSPRPAVHGPRRE